jgi:hypothetical protein
MSTRPGLLFAGRIGGTPKHGGATWAVLNYLLGFRDLGYDVTFVEPAGADAADHVAAALEPFGLRWAILTPDGDVLGSSRAELLAAGERADILVNVSGMLTDPALLELVPVRVYLDLDPAFVQLWQDHDGIDMHLAGHTHFVTLSDSVGRTIPDCGYEWLPTLPPVALRYWPVARATEVDAFTTVANWRGYGSVYAGGIHYGQKAHSLRPLFALPTRVQAELLLALAIHPAETSDLDALAAYGWRVVDPATVAATPADYQRFVAGSRAEFGLAKSGYVVSDSGWFSDRSACYLASGRPVAAMQTGWARRLPNGTGLIGFSDLDSAAAAIEEIEGDYAAHRKAARGIAEGYLDATTVLGAWLDRVLR